MSAVISKCGQYRYILSRSLGSARKYYRPILFIMLNPSTADAEKDDATIRRCIGFSKKAGMTQLNVVNLFAYRSTNPSELKNVKDPVGPTNDHFIIQQIKRNNFVVAAWGSDTFAKERADYIAKKFGPFLCLGKTKDGSPKHPLYLKSDTEFINYS